MPLLKAQPRRAVRFEVDYDRVQDLARTLIHEAEQLVPTLGYMKRTFAQRDALLDMLLDLRKQARSLYELAGQGSVPRSALTCEADQLLASLNQMKQTAAELRESAQSLEAVVSFGKAIQLQGKIAVIECLAKMLLFELE